MAAYNRCVTLLYTKVRSISVECRWKKSSLILIIIVVVVIIIDIIDVVVEP